MTYFKGKTVEKAVRKAVQGQRKQSASEMQACRHLKNDLENVRNLLRSEERQMQTLQSQVDRLKREQRDLILRLAFDIALITLPVTKLLRVTRILDRIIELIHAADVAAQIESAIEVLLSILGVLDGINNIMRSFEIPDELRGFRQQIGASEQRIRQARQQLQTVLAVYRRNRCGDILGEMPMV